MTFSVILLTLTADSSPFRQQQAFLSCMASHLHNILSSFYYCCTFSAGISSTGRILARLVAYSWLHINHTPVTALTHSCTGSISSLHPPLCSSSQYFTFTNIFLLTRGMLSWDTRMFFTTFFTPENTLIQLWLQNFSYGFSHQIRTHLCAGKNMKLSAKNGDIQIN